MADDRRAELAHLNLMEVNELLTRAEAEGVVDRRGGELLFAGDHPFPMLNGAMRSETGDATGFVARACEFFGERGRGWVAFARPDDVELVRALEAAGLHLLMDYPEMACPAPLPEPQLPAGQELRQVAGEGSARAYWDVCERAYRSLGFPAGVFDSFGADLLLRDEVRAWVAHVDGEPAATALLVSTGRVGMVGWVATLEERRGAGLGAACTVRATNAAFERGAELASLQASPMGESLYRRLGYEELFKYRLYVHGRFA